MMLERDLDEIDANGQFIPWKEAKKNLISEQGNVRIRIEGYGKRFHP